MDHFSLSGGLGGRSRELLQKEATRMSSLIASSSDPLHFLPSQAKSPTGSYPTPETWNTLPSTQTSLTVISFVVSVPVLSVQMTVVLPRVSTEESFLTVSYTHLRA